MSIPHSGELEIGKVFISQRDNYAANFGAVFRSSAIFWSKNGDGVKTTISFCNYWLYKNSLEVGVILTLRTLEGNLLQRIPVSFETSDVFNFVAPDSFEGSVEVEVFCAKNLRIPYAAIMAVYETSESISMVHSYARAYSQHEIEERRVITEGRESCWTLRETDRLTSFCVFHNGSLPCAEQTIELGVRNHHGLERTCSFELPALNPYQTCILEPRRYFPEIAAWLGGEPGNGRMRFRLNGGFTRMLCGIRDLTDGQIQVTHSNFDYSIHETDVIEEGSLKAYMLSPDVGPGRSQEIVVYPDSRQGRYRFDDGSISDRYETGSIYRRSYDSHAGRCVSFATEESSLPTRIVTGLRINSDLDVVPAECSLGVVHHETPKKHFAWMLVSREFNSSISWTDYREVYGGCPEEAKLVFKLYRPGKKGALSKEYTFGALPASGTIGLDEIFDEPLDLDRSFGYLTTWCSYGGLVFFSTIQKGRSISIEHSF